jgi:hypothetical protein
METSERVDGIWQEWKEYLVWKSRQIYQIMEILTADVLLVTYCLVSHFHDLKKKQVRLNQRESRSEV